MSPNLMAARQPLLLVTHQGEMLDANTRAAGRLRPDAELVVLPLKAANAMDADPVAFVAAVVANVVRSGRQAGRSLGPTPTEPCISAG